MRLLLFLALSGIVHALLLQLEPAELAPPLLAVASPQKKMKLALTISAAKKQPVQKEELAATPPPPVQTPAPTPIQQKSKKVIEQDVAKQKPPKKKKRKEPVAPVPPPEAYQSMPLEPRMIDSAEYLNNPPPAYPRLARRRGLEGTVLLSVLVNQKGDAQSVEVKESSGHSILDEEAVRAVTGWRFVAATRQGEPVTSRVLVPVRFELQRK